MKKSSKDNNKQNEGNVFDRIFKENAEPVFLALVKKHFNLDIKDYKSLPHKFSKTLEREVDFLYKVILKDDTELLLHLEFQTENDSQMIYRMGMYHALVLQKYNLPIKPVVIYLGNSKSNMRNELNEAEIYTGFEIINLKTINTSDLLNSEIPEVIMLALLADFEKERSEAILRLIIGKLKKYSKSENELSKYQQQLIYLSRLRKLEDVTIKIVDEMPITYDIETDYLYKKGIEKGESRSEARISAAKEESETKGIKITLEIIKLYKQNKSIASIAKITGKTEGFVKAIIEDAF